MNQLFLFVYLLIFYSLMPTNAAFGWILVNIEFYFLPNINCQVCALLRLFIKRWVRDEFIMFFISSVNHYLKAPRVKSGIVTVIAISCYIITKYNYISFYLNKLTVLRSRDIYTSRLNILWSLICWCTIHQTYWVSSAFRWTFKTL